MIGKWFSQGATTYSTDVALNAGFLHVKLEYFWGGGPGVALLSGALVVFLSCLPDVRIIGATPRTSGGEYWNDPSLRGVQSMWSEKFLVIGLIFIPTSWNRLSTLPLARRQQ